MPATAAAAADAPKLTEYGVEGPVAMVLPAGAKIWEDGMSALIAVPVEMLDEIREYLQEKGRA